MPVTTMWTGRNGHRAVWLVLHGTACNGPCTAQAVAEYFRSTQGTNNPVSSHYIVGPDGVIVSCVDENDSAWANGIVTQGAETWWQHLDNPNYWTISIEFCKEDSANSSPLTPPQQEAGFALIERICKRNGILMRRADSSGGITGHFSIDPVNRARCPGNFPWPQLFTYLLGPTSAEKQATDDEWNDSPLTPIPPTGTIIHEEWLRRALDGFHIGPPLTGEKPSVDYNGDAIVVQRFAYARAERNGTSVRWFDARGEIR